MTDALPVSLIIVSRHRPDMLCRCLTAVAQMDHPNFEVIVVADPDGLGIARAFPVKAVAFDDPNISAARNLGIAAAAGALVAFIDDDAVPEPRWLSLLCAPFADPAIAAAGGHVVGTNGFSLQWQAGRVDRLLRTAPLGTVGAGLTIAQSAPGSAVEIKGVNCAYRRATIAGLGGFDPEIAYYLDETELNLRLAARSARVAVVPDARVHHAKAASVLRRADRAPTSLWHIGASTAVTLRRHGANAAELDATWTETADREHATLAAHVARGRLAAEAVSPLMATLADGFAQGRERTLSPLRAIPSTSADFHRFPSASHPVAVLAGRWFQSARLKAQAARMVQQDRIVRLFLFSPTTLYHHLRFTPDGYWLQTGGLFGKSLRTDRPFRLWRFSRRLARERALSRSGFGNT